MDLNKKSSLPLYLQLKEILQSKIESSELKPHARLPSERELAEEFGISRMTVRQTLSELAHQGLVYAIVGKGTYVAEPKIDQNLQLLTSFTEDMRNRGLRASSRLLRADLIPASPKLADILHIQHRAEVVKLERLRLADNIPLCLETPHLPHHLCPDILQHDLESRSLYAILRNEYGLKLGEASQTIEAALANEREIELLHLHAPSPVLLIERKTLLDGGHVIEYVKSAYRGDRYKFYTTLHGSG